MQLHSWAVRTPYKKSAMEVYTGRKIPCRTGDSNLHQCCAWLVGQTLCWLSFSHSTMGIKIRMKRRRQYPNIWGKANSKNTHLSKCWSEWKAFSELGLKPDNYSVRMLVYGLTSDRSMASPALFYTRMIPVLLQDGSNSHCRWIHCISQGINRNAKKKWQQVSDWQSSIRTLS